MNFRTLTFNMQNGQPWDEACPDCRDIDLSRTIEFLHEQNADVIFLQEVEQGHDGGFQAEPPPNYTRLREALKGYDSVFAYPAPNDTEIPFGLGLAIFSKMKLRDFARVDLPAPEIEFEYDGKKRRPSQRLLIGATTVIAGRAVRLMNTHLQAFFMIQSSSREHPAQRNLVEAELRACTSGAALLAGDFNCTPEEDLVGQFTAAGFRTAQNEEITWRRMPFVLDHLFYNASMRCESVRVIPTLTSDHHAVRAEFSFL